MYQSLNHVFRLVWSKAQQAWVVTSELSKGHRKQSGARKRLLVAVCALAVPQFLQAGPQLNTVQQGVGQVTQSGNTTTINQQSQQLSLDWKSFNVDANEQVNFNQPNRDALAINHINDVNGSQIHGQINANGQVWLVNPNGVLFGKDAQVNVGGIVASSLSLTANSNGQVSFDKTVTGSRVDNFGNIQTQQGGYIAFVGEQVSNHGSLQSAGGNVSLGGGSAVNLTFAGHGLLSLEVEQSTLDNLVDNQGLIQVEGGKVLLNAGAKDSLLASVVNNDGVIEAQGVVERDGEIILLSGMAAGTTTINGTLDASASSNSANGGFIETSGHKVKVADSSQVTTKSENLSGLWLIDPAEFKVAASGGDMTGAQVSEKLEEGHFSIQTTSSGSGDVIIDDEITWHSASKLTLNAYSDIEINRSITATGDHGKLDLLFGQGLGFGSDYSLNQGAQINLQAGNNFSTQYRDDTRIEYQVITQLGEEGSTTGADLQGMQGDTNKDYALGANIDAQRTKNWHAGKGFNPIQGGPYVPFTGTLHGLGHSIDQLTIKRADEDGVGLIGSTENAVIRDIALANVAITGNRDTGGLVGDLNPRSLVSHASTSGVVSGNYTVGGLVGSVNEAMVDNSFSEARVTGQSSVGGLIGRYVDDGVGAVKNSYASGDVSGEVSVGGLIGSTYLSSISNNYATGKVLGEERVGGLIGNALQASIGYSYATGQATGDNYVGGLIGSMSAGVAKNTYATPQVTGDTAVGGLIGSAANGARVENSFWDSQATGQSTSAGGVAKSPSEMHNLATFSGAGWDVDDQGGTDKRWRIYEGHTAPLLRSLLTPFTLPAFDGSGASLDHIAVSPAQSGKLLGDVSSVNEVV